ncbi:protein YIPF1 [Phlebotomus argentipes]|uniref:protein YIPF1 n=1 Tax=Phlebotomus argentipes TaxID=94469 RepID=UPI0028936F35|nr:protein YIPF1 [Phlebotomus argentipes]
MSTDSDELLSFKDFPLASANPSGSAGIAQININSPGKSGSGSGQRTDVLEELMAGSPDETEAAGSGKNYSFWSIEYYQQFFNVDTFMVMDRIASAIIPKRAPSTYLKSQIGSNPDLYGPIWIVITLIFSIAISGNVANYLQQASSNFHWHYNFHLVSYAATAIIIYASLVPLALWGAFKWSLKPVSADLETDTSAYTPGFLTLLCIYGYSLAIYVPVSILWVIQVSVLQWLLVITAALMSGSVLIFVMMPALRNSKFSLILILGIIGAHFLLAAGFMLYFFHVPNTNSPLAQLALNSTKAI